MRSLIESILDKGNKKEIIKLPTLGDFVGMTLNTFQTDPDELNGKDRVMINGDMFKQRNIKIAQREYDPAKHKDFKLEMSIVPDDPSLVQKFITEYILPILDQIRFTSSEKTYNFRPDITKALQKFVHPRYELGVYQIDKTHLVISLERTLTREVFCDFNLRFNRRDLII